MTNFPAEIAALLARVHTAPLQRPDAPTVALVVFNFGNTPVSPCRVRFAAAFPASAAKPVTVRDASGEVIPSRLVESVMDANVPNLPPGKVLWSLVLEFETGEELPARTGRAYAASYEPNPLELSDMPDTALCSLPVYETTCHAGELRLQFPLPDLAD